MLCVLALITPSLAALEHAQTLTRLTMQRNLHRDPVWLQLMHYEADGSRSEILSEDFFLAPHGATDPGAELTATLHGYFAPWGEDPNTHPRCRFPARYYWLSQQLELPRYALREPRCQRLERWAFRPGVRSVSLLLVSGYFGNPASTFGHSLLKLNTGAAADEMGLLDLSMNFGALVPENEATVLYVMRGLFGGYEAGFSDKYFYTQDLVYARTEFRDLWEYELSLSEAQRNLLVLHLWEITGKKFAYYFLTQNCAYRLGEVLELVTGEQFVEHAHLWFVPVELFHRLKDIDARRRAVGSPALIRSVRFIPSSQRVVYHQFAQLTPEQVVAANAVIADGPDTVSKRLRPFPAARRGEILDALLAYNQYQVIAEQAEPSAESRRAKYRVLAERLRLPPRTDPLPPVPELPSPADGPKPMVTSVGIAQQQDGETYWRLRWAPFSQELIEQKNLEDGELAVLDLAVGVGHDWKPFIDQIDVVRVRKLNTRRTQITGESRLSWQLQVGARRVEHSGAPRHDGFTRIGAGRAWKAADDLAVYGMMDVAVHARTPHGRMRPHVGLIGGGGGWRVEFKLGLEKGIDGEPWQGVWSGQLQYHLSKGQAVHLDFANDVFTRGALSLIWFW